MEAGELRREKAYDNTLIAVGGVCALFSARVPPLFLVCLLLGGLLLYRRETGFGAGIVILSAVFAWQGVS